jgi:hypothetical protein
MDIECALCGEPWDAYGVRHHLDMTREEAYLFLQGQGCPSCNFGENKERVLPEGNVERFMGSLIDAMDE